MHHVFELTAVETEQAVHYIEAEGGTDEKLVKSKVWEHMQANYAPSDFLVDGASEWNDFALVWRGGNEKQGSNPNYERINTKGENPTARTF